LSPSSFAFEPWKFVVIQNPALREKLKPVSAGCEEQLDTASHFVVILARREESLRPDSVHVNKIWRDTHLMPEEVAQDWYDFYESFVETELEDNDRLMFEWSIRQTYIALGNMMTAAAQIGIDSCPMEGFTKKQVTAILQNEGIINGDDFGVACMVAFGYRQKERKRPQTRLHLDEIVEWR